MKRDADERGKWRTKSYAIRLSQLESPQDELRIYFWNPQKNTVLIDDIEMDLLEEK